MNVGKWEMTDKEMNNALNYVVQSQQSDRLMEEIAMSLEECPSCYGSGMEPKGWWLSCPECGLILSVFHDEIDVRLP